MRVLLVDNDTHYKRKISELLSEMELTIVPYQEINFNELEGNFDLIVLSGTQGGNSVKKHADKLWAKEQELVLRTKTPIIGICMGAQLIAHSFGARLSLVPGKERIKGIKKHIYNIKQTPFTFFPYFGGSVFTSHRWRITELPDELEAWCASAEGVELFKHKTRPIYGLQFHPERRAQNNDGARIFFTIVKLETGFESTVLKQLSRNVKKKPKKIKTGS